MRKIHIHIDILKENNAINQKLQVSVLLVVFFLCTRIEVSGQKLQLTVSCAHWSIEGKVQFIPLQQKAEIAANCAGRTRVARDQSCQ
jgi:hypothetical protein